MVGVIITSKYPSHRTLAKDIEKVTLRMVRLRRVIDVSTRAFREAMEVYESFREVDEKGKDKPVPEKSLDHVVKTKHMLGGLQECIEAANEEFDLYVEEFEHLDAKLQRLIRAERERERKEKLTGRRGVRRTVQIPATATSSEPQPNLANPIQAISSGPSDYVKPKTD